MTETSKENEMDTEVTINTLDREEIHRLIAALPAAWGLIDERDGSTLSETVDQVIEALRKYANPEPEKPGITCGMCSRARTVTDPKHPMDAYDYSPLQVVMGQPLGWYSGDDGEICPECMTGILRRQ